jgi:hypothetical protein
MRNEIFKLLHDAEPIRRLDLSGGFVAGLLIVAPGAGLTRHRQRPNTLDNGVIAVDVAIQATRFAVGNNIHARAFLVEDRDSRRIREQFVQIVRPPAPLLC